MYTYSNELFACQRERSAKKGASKTKTVTICRCFSLKQNQAAFRSDPYIFLNGSKTKTLQVTTYGEKISTLFLFDYCVCGAVWKFSFFGFETHITETRIGIVSNTK